MQIITLGRVGGIGEGDDHIYQGNGSLMRFTINSADDFFAIQLPWIVNTLEIDIRQIMRLELLGDGPSGLDQASILISIEDRSPAAEHLDDLYGKLCDAPSTPASDSSDDRYDILRGHLIDFFSVAPNAVKARFMKESAQILRSKQVEAKQFPHESHIAGYVYRVSYAAGSPPSIAEWRNVLLHCSDRLRASFRPERLSRLTFTPIPNSEQSYQAEAELLLPLKTRVYRPRTEIRFRARPTRQAGPSALIFQTVPPEQKLTQLEKALLDKFDHLDTRDRLKFWNKHLSKFFK